MTDVIFALITGAVALIGTLLWLFAVSYFAMKYFEYRLKEKGGGDEETKEDL